MCVCVWRAELVPPNGRLPWEPDTGLPYPSERDLQFDFKTTGAEDAIHAIAVRDRWPRDAPPHVWVDPCPSSLLLESLPAPRLALRLLTQRWDGRWTLRACSQDYYGVPCVSLRGALFTDFKANSSTYPIKQIYHDRHHPSAWGHSLMAQMVVKRIEEAIDYAKAARASSGVVDGGGGAAEGLEPFDIAYRGGGACNIAHAEMRGIGPGGVPTASKPGPRLYAPLYSRADQAPVGACYKDHELQKRLVNAKGFSYGT